MADQGLEGQRLHADHVVLANPAGGQLVLVQAITALVGTRGTRGLQTGEGHSCRVSSRCLPPFWLRASVRWACARRRSPRRRCLGVATCSPELNTARSFRPTSTPTSAFTTGSAWMSASTRNETRARSAGSRTPLSVAGVPVKDLDHWSGRGARVLARVRARVWA